MAAKAKEKEQKATPGLKKKINYAPLHKLSAAVSLIAFVVIIMAGMMAEARVTTITYRAFIVILIIGIVTRVLMKVLASYEEMK